MFKRIMVALDGSPIGEAVLPTVEKLMRASDARVDLVRVVPAYVGNGREADPGIAKRAREALEYVEPIAGRLRDQGVNARAQLRFGLPVEELLKFAAVEGVDIIAMTTHGRTGMRRWMLGSVTEQVIRNATTPVLAMKSFQTVTAGGPPDEGRGFRKILVTLDGSPRAERVLTHVAAIARIYEALVTIMTVDLQPIPGTEPAVPVSAYPLPHPKSYVERICEGLRAKGVMAQGHVERGLPAEHICAYLGAHDIDLVAMATHGRTGASRWILGSTVERVLRTVHTPVLILRVPEGEETKEPGNGQDA